jgi:hypothetical protein
MVKGGSKNGHRKDMCLKKIRLCIQNMLGQIVNIIVEEGGGTRPLNKHKNVDIDLE